MTQRVASSIFAQVNITQAQMNVKIVSQESVTLARQLTQMNPPVRCSDYHGMTFT